jgi:hypothetical protein
MAARYEECSREGAVVYQTLVSVSAQRGGTVSLASSRYEGVVDTFVW